MDWEKTLWNLEVPVDETVTTGLAEAEVSIPEDRDGALRFLCCQANVEEASAQSVQGSVQVQGTVLFTVLYETASGLASLESRNNFKHPVNMSKAQSGQRVQLKTTPLSTQARWVNERLCMVECVLEMQVTLFERQEKSPITGVQGKGMQTATTPLQGAWLAGTSHQVTTLREDVELAANTAAAEVILSSQGQVEIDQIGYQAARADVTGNVRIAVMYSAASPIWMQKTDVTLPFTLQWDAQELSQAQWLLGEGRVQDCQIKVYENLKGEKRVLAVEAQIALTVQGFAAQQTRALVDAYCPDEEIVLEKQTWQIPGQPRQTQAEAAVVGDMKLPEGTAMPQQILQVLSYPVVDTVLVEAGKASFSGRIMASVFHVSGEDHIMGCINGQAPFEMAVAVEDLKPGDWTQVELAGLQPGASVTAQGTLQIKDLLQAMITWRSVEEQQVVVDAAGRQWESALPSGLMLVVTQPGEDSWAVAKRLRIPLEVLVAANPQLEKRGVQNGECLVVER